MSNKTINLLKKRKSSRIWLDKKISDKIINEIIEAAQQAPNSINAQQTSLIVTRDKNKIAKIAEYAGGQPQVKNADVFITVAIDFYKTNEAAKLHNKNQVVQTTLEGNLVGAIDAGIMVEALSIAAESFEIGNTVIGGIRNNPQAMIDLLELPEYTFPVVGIALGYPKPNTASVKPRMSKNSFAHFEKYDRTIIPGAIKEYDAILNHFFEDLGLNMPTNSESTSQQYSEPYYLDVKATMEKQGFNQL